MLVDATVEALDATGVERLVVSGGVVRESPAARAAWPTLGAARGVEVLVPRPALCTDNAAMIALAGMAASRARRRTTASASKPTPTCRSASPGRR